MAPNPMSLVDKLKELSPERIAEVENFIEFLRQRVKQRSPASLADFPVDHVGVWPQQLMLRREDFYGEAARKT